jgi:hypothetical protein
VESEALSNEMTCLKSQSSKLSCDCSQPTLSHCALLCRKSMSSHSSSGRTEKQRGSQSQPSWVPLRDWEGGGLLRVRTGTCPLRGHLAFLVCSSAPVIGRWFDAQSGPTMTHLLGHFSVSILMSSQRKPSGTSYTQGEILQVVRDWLLWHFPQEGLRVWYGVESVLTRCLTSSVE